MVYCAENPTWKEPIPIRFHPPIRSHDLKFMTTELEQDLSWITPHVMRHTFGSLLAIAGERA